MLPHHNNDGGFFAALIKKVKPLPWEKGEMKPQELLDKFGNLYSTRLRKSIKRQTFENPVMPKVRKFQTLNIFQS